MQIIFGESLESWVLDIPNITPNFKSVLNSGHVFYSDKIISQVKYGTSGDGQWLILIPIITSLLIAILPNSYVSYMRHNSIGWMPEFIMGILFARNKNIIQGKLSNRAMFPIIVILVVLFSFTRYTFMICGIAFIVALLILRKQLSQSKLLIYIGKMSASIYVIHAVIRQVMLWINPPITLPFLKALIVLFISILLSIPYQYSYNKICNRLLESNKNHQKE